MTLDPNSSGFNWSNALALLDAAATAYQEHTLCDPRTDAQALIRDLKDCVVVAFRGSQAPVDFVQDAKFALASDEVAEVHAGFLEDFQAIGGPVVARVKALLAAHDTFRPVYVTGHSLGGALAILCAWEFVRQKIPVAGVYTFGQPRVGNSTFAALYDRRLADKTWRLVNANDLVPRLPGVLLGYRHCGQEILLTTGGGYLVNPPLWQKALSDVAGLTAAFCRRHDVLIRDHFLESYRTAMAQDARPALVNPQL
jgi:triacylglycerol lipase